MASENRQIIVYIAGKYSGSIDENIQKARETAIQVWEAGFTALTPHLNTAHFEIDCECYYQDYLIGDLELLRRCDCVLFIEGWKDSSGARQEHEFAEKNKIPIFYSVEELFKHYDPVERLPDGRPDPRFNYHPTLAEQWGGASYPAYKEKKTVLDKMLENAVIDVLKQGEEYLIKNPDLVDKVELELYTNYSGNEFQINGHFVPKREFLGKQFGG